MHIDVRYVFTACKFNIRRLIGGNEGEITLSDLRKQIKPGHQDTHAALLLPIYESETRYTFATCCRVCGSRVLSGQLRVSNPRNADEGNEGYARPT